MTQSTYTQTCSTCKHWHKLEAPKQNVAGVGTATVVGQPQQGECRESPHLVEEPLVATNRLTGEQSIVGMQRRFIYGPCPENFPACGRYELRRQESF